MISHIHEILLKDDGQDIAEYAVMLAVILVVVIGTITTHRLECQQCVLGGCKLDSIVQPSTRQTIGLEVASKGRTTRGHSFSSPAELLVRSGQIPLFF